MLLSSLNTGSTDLRDTEVQQPNTTETLSLVMSSRAFSANSGQFEAGSTTTASSFLPSRPPFLFCSSMSISMTSFSVVSLIAIVPDKECRTPTLIVSCACAVPITAPETSAAEASAIRCLRVIFNIDMDPLPWLPCFRCSVGSLRKNHAKPRLSFCLRATSVPDDRWQEQGDRIFALKSSTGPRIGLQHYDPGD